MYLVWQVEPAHVLGHFRLVKLGLGKGLGIGFELDPDPKNLTVTITLTLTQTQTQTLTLTLTLTCSLDPKTWLPSHSVTITRAHWLGAG